MTLRYVQSGAGGSADGSSWANAYTTISAAATAGAAGDTYWISDTHAETTAAAITPTFKGTPATPDWIYCVDHTVASGFTDANLKTTGQVSTTGASSNITVQGTFFMYGVIFNIADVANAGIFSTALLSNGIQKYRSCKFQMSTNAASYFNFGSLGNPRCANIFENCIFAFGNAGQSIRDSQSYFVMRGGSITGTIPSTLMISGTGDGSSMFEGVDLSLVTGTLGMGSMAGGGCGLYNTFKDCKVASGVTWMTPPVAPADHFTDYIRCASDATNYRHGRIRYAGTQTADATVYRTGGASDGTTPFSENIITAANSNIQEAFEMMPIGVWNATIGSTVTATFYGIINSAAVPNQVDIWIDEVYLGNASFPLGSIANLAYTSLTAPSALSSDSTSVWNAPVRLVSHAYVVGNAISVGSNSRIFVCTTSGNSSNDATAGAFTSAVDGGTVNESAAGSGGVAVFRAVCRFSMTLAVTPQMAGDLTLTIKAAKASTTFWVDPQPVMS